jgi:hypothetical protein
MSEGLPITRRWYDAAQRITPPAFLTIEPHMVEALIAEVESCQAIPGEDFKQRFREAIVNGTAKIYGIGVRL